MPRSFILFCANLKEIYFNENMKFQRAKVVACAPHEGYKIWICFDDGLSGEVDLSHLVGKGVFEAWKSRDFFNSVHIDGKTETVTWGDEIDLDPYVLREKVVSHGFNSPT